jgi:glyoxylase I family protein
MMHERTKYRYSFVDDLRSMIAHLESIGVAVVQKPEWNSEVGEFARIHDSDGNPIELWQPSDYSLKMI